MKVRHAKVGHRVADRIAYLERIARSKQVEESKNPAFDTRVRITVVSYRVRLTDTDGVSAKAAIDGLVLAGVLKDDSHKYVEEVRYSQKKVSKASEQKTQIIIEAVEDSDGGSNIAT